MPECEYLAQDEITQVFSRTQDMLGLLERDGLDGEINARLGVREYDCGTSSAQAQSAKVMRMSLKVSRSQRPNAATNAANRTRGSQRGRATAYTCTLIHLQ